MQTSRVGAAVDYLTAFSRSEFSPTPSSDSPENGAAAAQASELLDSARRGLTPKQAAIVWLFYWQGHSLAEIATTLELPEETVRSHHHRARRRLRAELAARGITRTSDIL